MRSMPSAINARMISPCCICGESHVWEVLLEGQSQPVLPPSPPASKPLPAATRSYTGGSPIQDKILQTMATMFKTAADTAASNFTTTKAETEARERGQRGDRACREAIALLDELTWRACWNRWSPGRTLRGSETMEARAGATSSTTAWPPPDARPGGPGLGGIPRLPDHRRRREHDSASSD